MNISEGTRRLALLLGAAGAIAGGVASYLQLQTALDQRARHNRFEQLAASDVVTQERKTLKDWTVVSVSQIDPKTGESFRIDPKTGERIDLSDGLIPKRTGHFDYDTPVKKYGEVRMMAPAQGSSENSDRKGDTGVVLDWSRSKPLPSEMEPNKSGIATINWSHDFGVESIKTEDGQTLYPTPSPPEWMYTLIPLFPLIGFLVPWGTVRAIGWVLVGFLQSGNVH